MNICRKRNGRLSATGLSLLSATLVATAAIGVSAFGQTPPRGLAGSYYYYSSSSMAQEIAKPDACAYLHLAFREDALAFPNSQAPTEREFEIYKGTQAYLVKSRGVLTQALRDPTINRLPILQKEENPVSWLAENIEVSFPGNVAIMQVGIRTNDLKDLKEAAALVNAVVKAYMETVVQDERRRRQERVSELDRIYTKKDAELRSKGNELRALANTLGVDADGTLSSRRQMAVQEFAIYASELARVRGELARINARLEVQQALLSDADDMEVSELELNALFQSDPDAKHMTTLLEQTPVDLRDRLNFRRAELRSELLDRQRVEAHSKTDNIELSEVELNTLLQSDPEAKRITTVIEETSDDLRKRLDVRREQLRKQLLDGHRLDIKATIRQATLDRAALRGPITILEREVEQRRKAVEQASRSFIDIEIGRSEIRRMKEVMQQIGTARDKTVVELKARSRISVLQLAEAPNIKTPPKD